MRIVFSQGNRSGSTKKKKKTKVYSFLFSFFFFFFFYRFNRFERGVISLELYYRKKWGGGGVEKNPSLRGYVFLVPRSVATVSSDSLTNTWYSWPIYPEDKEASLDTISSPLIFLDSLTSAPYAYSLLQADSDLISLANYTSWLKPCCCGRESPEKTW